MYKKIILSLLMMFCVVHELVAQVEVKGGIFVQQTTFPCIFAKLYIQMNGVDTKEIHDVTDTLGVFSFQLPTSDSAVSYSMRIVHVETKDTTVTFTQNVGDKIIDLGTFILEPSEKELSEVEISSKKPKIERKIDRLLFNIEGTVNEFGKNAFSLLGRTPLVFVQGRESISVVGKGNATILINDRYIYLDGENLTAYLESIPSEDVERIEVITNPPVKYEGRGVLINIVLKKNKMLGFNGRVNTSYQQKFYSSPHGGLSLNYRKNKMNVYGVASGSNAQYRSTHEYRYDFRTNNNIKEESTVKRYYTNYRALLGLDYTFSEKNDLSITVERTGMDMNRDGVGTSKFYKGVIDDKTIFDSTSTVSQKYKRMGYYYMANAQFNSVINKKDGTLTATATYGYNDLKPRNSYIAQNRILNASASDLHQLNSTSQQTVQFGIVKLDFEQPTSKGKITYGAKYARINNRNNNSIERFVNEIKVIDTTLQYAEYDYTEHNSALYASYFHQWEHDQVQIGLRGEYTQLKGENKTSGKVNNREILELFPTIEYMHQFNELLAFQAGVNRVVERPSYSDLNPFRTYNTTYRYESGNPELLPMLVATAEAGLALGDVVWLGGAYLNNHNITMPVAYMDSSTNYEIAEVDKNIGHTNQFSLLLWLGLGAGDWFNGSVEIFYTHNRFTSNFESIRSERNNQLTATIDFEFMLPNNFAIGADLTLVPWGSYYTIHHMDKQYILNIDASQRLFNNQFVIGIGLTDLFRMRQPIARMMQAPYTLHEKDYWDSRTFYLSLAYSFGNRFLKNKKERSMGIEEEKGRI